MRESDPVANPSIWLAVETAVTKTKPIVPCKDAQEQGKHRLNLPSLHQSITLPRAGTILTGYNKRSENRWRMMMEYKIKGELAQVAHLTFNQGETCWSSKGALMAFDPDIQWTLKVPGGVEGAVRRVFSGEGVTLTHISATRDEQKATLASNQAGKMISWNLDEGAVVTTRGSFIAAFGQQVDIDVIVAKRAGAALFGGAGLFLQKVSGSGTALVHGSGDFIDYFLQKDESVLVSTGNLAAFSETVDYNIQSIGGVRRVLFGGEGLFMTKLTGPGRVLLQSLKRVTAAANSSAGG